MNIYIIIIVISHISQFDVDFIHSDFVIIFNNFIFSNFTIDNIEHIIFRITIIHYIKSNHVMIRFLYITVYTDVISYTIRIRVAITKSYKWRDIVFFCYDGGILIEFITCSIRDFQVTIEQNRFVRIYMIRLCICVIIYFQFGIGCIGENRFQVDELYIIVIVGIIRHYSERRLDVRQFVVWKSSIVYDKSFVSRIVKQQTVSVYYDTVCCCSHIDTSDALKILREIIGRQLIDCSNLFQFDNILDFPNLAISEQERITFDIISVDFYRTTQRHIKILQNCFTEFFQSIIVCNIVLTNEQGNTIHTAFSVFAVDSVCWYTWCVIIIMIFLRNYCIHHHFL